MSCPDVHISRNQRNVFNAFHTHVPCLSASAARQRSCSGFSLLEVLISLFIFSVGFLGLASLQHVAMQLTHDSVLHNTAINLAESLITRIRVEGDSLNISDWQSDVNKNLPDGKGNLLKQGEDYTLTLQWQESPHSANGSAGHQYSRSFKSAH